MVVKQRYMTIVYTMKKEELLMDTLSGVVHITPEMARKATTIKIPQQLEA
jgi:hypothetical protein